MEEEVESSQQREGGESRKTAEKSSVGRQLAAGSCTSTLSLTKSRGGKARRPEQGISLPRLRNLANANANAATTAKEETVDRCRSERSTLVGSTKSLQEISRVSHRHQDELLLRRGEELGSTKSLQELRYSNESPLTKSLQLRSRSPSQEGKSEEVLLRSSTQEVLLKRGEELGSTGSLQEFQLVPVAENVKRAILIVKEETATTEGKIVGGEEDLVTLKIAEERVNDRAEKELKRSRLKAEKEKELEALRAEEMARMKERKMQRDEEIERVKQKILELERAREELLEKKCSRERTEGDEKKVKEEEMGEEEKRRMTEQCMVQAEMKRRTEETWKRIQMEEEEKEQTLTKTQEKSLIKEGEGEMKEREKEEAERKERVLRLRQEIRRRRKERLEGEAKEGEKREGREMEGKPAPISILREEEEGMKHLKLSHIYRQPPTRLTVK